MTLQYLPLNLELPLTEGLIDVLSVEEPGTFSKMLLELQKASEGVNCNWLLADNHSELKISKQVDILWNSLFVDLNEKKMLNALYKELAMEASDTLFSDYSDINSSAISFLDKLTMMVPYPLTFELYGDISSFFKLYQLKFEDDATSPVERLTNYLKLCHEVKHISCFVGINLKQFFSLEELHELYRFVQYQKLQLLILEGYHSKALPLERNWIVDKDLCIIEL